MFRYIVCLFFSLSVYANSDNFGEFLLNIRLQASEIGVSEKTLDATLNNLTINPQIIKYDRSQAEFSQNFWRYIKSRVSEYRITRGTKELSINNNILSELYEKYGIPGHIIVAFWGLETNYGNNTGSHLLVRSLATLSFDNRRSKFFTEQLLSLLKLIDDGKIPLYSKGSWAGAMGNVQFMPTNVTRYAIDADGDGKLGLWNSKLDTFSSASNFLQHIGWRRGERWGREVVIPINFDYELSGLKTKKTVQDWSALGLKDATNEPLPDSNMKASLLLPMGHLGPAFLIYHNFFVILNWNRSILYALSVGRLSDRLIGMDKLTAIPIDEPLLSRKDITYIQNSLNSFGIDAGIPDGISGSKTRSAAKQYQINNGIPADGYIGQQLLKHIKSKRNDN
jgi:membrane-bound lytic murein transglycosylase B